MNKLFITGLVALSISGVAQSKKELEAQINKLKMEIEQLKPKEVVIANNAEKVSYGLGVLMASNLRRQGNDSISIDHLVAGLKDVYLNKTLKVNENDAMTIVQAFMQQTMEKKVSEIKKTDAAFLNENKTKEGVKVTPSGLQYKVISSSGSGKKPTATDRVTVHYTGKLTDGTTFDSSVQRGTPATFALNEVIKGWTEALQMMNEGDKWMLFVPSELGYGERGAGSQIPPYSTLVFEVELIKVN